MSKEETSNKASTPMTDEERLKLAEKLDKELDEFINGLEKRQYTEGWPEDKWEEEMEKHPFFMKKAPEPGAELHPLLEGIQQLKYDLEENTAEELATSYKEDGNFNFKHKNYRLAILSYTEGIKQKHENKELQASLYNNRAASHFFLKNYRSCLRDCEIALRLKPDYLKAKNRAAQCCFELNQFEKCIELCTELLTTSPADQIILSLRQRATNAYKNANRDSRRQKRKQVTRNTETERLINKIKIKGIKLMDVRKKNSTDDDDKSVILKPVVGQLEGADVHFDQETGLLVWPVVFVYPEFGIMDFIRSFTESDTLYSHLSEIFRSPAEWDPEHRYKADTVRIYYEQELPNHSVKLHTVPVDSTLIQAITKEGYSIRHGTPQFFVLQHDSKYEKYFLNQYL